ncbi:hypothetical protein [Nannocystis punicea]|uniref:Right handed beta helix domain-containing protein n=1 Tax=Nannocystis punicea TaxID=2995304 RepID=A0ABY7HGD9_9BACT|nr:hypothetical protein [Nannocystis poenicansa]WAS98382.1 hypothetical protein O0S08_19750 [Nannocystis poenicansa]
MGSEAAGSGKCVECTPDQAQQCSGNTPACDPETHTCVPCTEHSQCPNSACDIFEGSCFPEGEGAVFYVQGSNVDCPAKTGLSEDSPFCKLTNVPLQNVSKATIRLMSGSQPPGGLTIGEGKAVAIVRHKTLVSELNGGAILGPILTVNGGARLYLWDVKLRSGQQSIVKCTSGRFYAHEAWWDGNNLTSLLALDAFECDVFVHRSQITRLGAAMQLTGGNLWIENSFILESGGNNSLAAFNFKGGAKGTITYSTIAHNRVVNGVSTFQCEGVPELVVRNSAVVGIADVVEAECEPGVSFVNGRMEEVPDKAAADVVMTKWFNAPVEDVYTPKKGADTLEGTATWQEGDPRKDFFNMTAIPTDEPSFAGARQPL